MKSLRNSLHGNRMAKMKRQKILTVGEHVAHPEVSCIVSGGVNWHNNFGILLGLTVCAKPEEKKKYMSYSPQFQSYVYT